MGRRGSVATHDLEMGPNYSEPRSSIELMSSMVPSTNNKDSSQGRFSYNPLHEQPLMLTVVKLDGTSFGIEVECTRTVGDLKRAVESAFNHLPKNGAASISWKHVWGKFCLCHEGQKLLNDNDYIGQIGINDGDKLQFVHHDSRTAKLQSAIEDPDSDEENNVWKRNRVPSTDNKNELESDDDDDDFVHCNCSLNQWVKRWFQYNKLGRFDKAEIERQRHSRRFKEVPVFKL